MKTLTLSFISQETYLTTDDIAVTLYLLDILQKRENEWEINVNIDMCEKYMERVRCKNVMTVNGDFLEWEAVYTLENIDGDVVQDIIIDDVEVIQEDQDVIQDVEGDMEIEDVSEEIGDDNSSETDIEDNNEIDSMIE